MDMNEASNSVCGMQRFAFILPCRDNKTLSSRQPHRAPEQCSCFTISFFLSEIGAYSRFFYFFLSGDTNWKSLR